MDDKLIVALDVETLERAERMVDNIGDACSIYKIGSQLFTAYGPVAVKMVQNKGARVFLDLKFHDIPNTVQRASEEVTKLGVFMFNIHASGGLEMIKAAVEGINRVVEKRKDNFRPYLLAVTILTSIDDRILKNDLKINLSPGVAVLNLARLAKEGGADGVVASPRELVLLRREFGNDFKILTPGIRPLGSSLNDQKRFLAPSEAIKSGADFIVVGRPVLEAADPRDAVLRILNELYN